MSPKLIAHFRDPKNVGELAPPAVTVEVENPICGDILRLSARFDDAGQVVEARYKARGCTASIAAGSALTELILAGELKEITRESVERALGGLSSESKHAAVLCADAAKALIARK